MQRNGSDVSRASCRCPSSSKLSIRPSFKTRKSHNESREPFRHFQLRTGQRPRIHALCLRRRSTGAGVFFLWRAAAEGDSDVSDGLFAEEAGSITVFAPGLEAPRDAATT